MMLRSHDMIISVFSAPNMIPINFTMKGVAKKAHTKLAMARTIQQIKSTTLILSISIFLIKGGFMADKKIGRVISS